MWRAHYSTQLLGFRPWNLQNSSNDFSRPRSKYKKGCDGVVDTMPMLLFHDSFTKSRSDEYNLRLLTQWLILSVGYMCGASQLRYVLGIYPFEGGEQDK